MGRIVKTQPFPFALVSVFAVSPLKADTEVAAVLLSLDIIKNTDTAQREWLRLLQCVPFICRTMKFFTGLSARVERAMGIEPTFRFRKANDSKNKAIVTG